MPVPSRREALVRPVAAAPTPAEAVIPASTAAVPTAALVPAGAPPVAAAAAKGHAARSTGASRPPRPARGGHAWPKLDVAIASGLVVLAFVAATSLPAGSLRLALVLPMLLFAPGYLLLQAFVVPAAPRAARTWQGLASLGISPAVLGLLALATSIVQGGFRLDAILLLATIGSLAFAATALVRRRNLARAAGSPKPADSPQAATAKTGPARP
ncbi:MAG TPA: DUF1616 domain-containing protein [Candidatus Thermoplasmatota archaeon]|nr:DUF1616 domain-containing protein [Candidatus Thermoplasmatota archaeon]